MKWVSVKERLPDDLTVCIVTYVNHNPESYYEDIKDIPFTGVMVYRCGSWNWYSDVTEDILAEYPECERYRINDALEVTHWMYLPKTAESEDNMETVKLKVLVDGCEPQKTGGNKSDWVDLRAAKDYTMKKGDLELIKLGVAMQLPDGYEAIIAPRSSMAKKFGIIQANSIGVIDNSYCGDNDEWGLFAYAIRDTEIHKGNRICQFRIQKNQPELRFEEVETLGNKDRGGWGSTGKR